MYSSSSSGSPLFLAVSTPRAGSHRPARPAPRTLTPRAVLDLDNPSSVEEQRRRAVAHRTVVGHANRRVSLEDDARDESLWRDSATGAVKSKAILVAEIESLLARTCSNRTMPVEERVSNFCHTIEHVAMLVPAFSSIFSSVKSYMGDLASEIVAEREAMRRESATLRERVVAERDEFYRDKFTALAAEKRRLTRLVASLETTIEGMKRARDEELQQVKAEVWGAVRKCYDDEAEHKTMRELITAVFRTNQELRDRLRDYEGGAAIAIPPPTAATGEAPMASPPPIPPIPQRRLIQQVPIEFIAASKQEVDRSRLAMQRILVQCASESQSTFKVMLEKKTAEVEALKDANKKLQEELRDFEEVVHARRFADTDANSQSDGEVELDRKTLFESGRLTPRPAIPFEVQGDLGVNLRRSSRRIVRELAALALSQRRELNDALLRVRRLSQLATWMDDSMVQQIAADNGDVPFLRPEKSKDWPEIAHFLRTHVEAEVPNRRWSSSDTAKVLRVFFEGFDGYLHASRLLSDEKVCAPKTVQQWERMQAIPTRFDATLAEMRASASNVPCGYIVTTFIRDYLANIATGIRKNPYPVGESLVGAGATGAAIATASLRRRSVADQLEFEVATFAYNLWHAVRRFKDHEPVCELFLLLLEGRVPYTVFNCTTRAIDRVRDALQAQDAVKSNYLSFRQLNTALLTVFADKPGCVWRELLYATVETMSSFGVPLQGKIAAGDVLATETHPRGPSTLTRFVRHHVVHLHVVFYQLIEETLRPLVFESAIRPGLMLIHIEAAVRAIRALQSEVAPKFAAKTQDEPPLLNVIAVEDDGDGGEGEKPAASTTSSSDLTTPRAAAAVNVEATPASPQSTTLLQAAEEGKTVQMPPPKVATEKVRERRTAAPQADFVQFVEAVLRNCPRLNASVHCRPTSDEEPVDAGAGVPSTAQVKTKRRNKHRQVSISSATLAIVNAVNDQLLTEFFAVMQAIRLTPVDLHDRLSSKAAHEDVKTQLGSHLAVY